MTNDSPPADPQKNSLAAKLLRPKVAIPLLIVFLLLISPFLIRGWFLRGVPNAPEPFDAEPLLEYSVPDAENAFNDYRMAKSLYIQPTLEISELRDRINDEGWHLANDDIRQFLHDNEDALLAWRTGSEKKRANYIPAKERHALVELDLVSEMQEMHRTVMLLCRQLEAEGRPQEAWEWYRSSFRASRHVGTGGSEIERIVGGSHFKMAAVQLEKWAADPRLSSSDIRLALEQLQQDWTLTEKTSTSLMIAYLGFSRSLKEHPELLVAGYGLEPIVSPRFWYFVGEPELSERLMRFYYHNQIQFCDLPRYQRPKTTPGLSVFDDPVGFTIDDVEWSAAEFRNTYERSIVASMLFGAIQQYYLSLDREAARYKTAVVMLAGQAFRRDRGRFPNTLDELVPEYFDSIPIDNFDGKPLKYRFDPAGPVVYSVHENLKDDGGLEWSSQSRIIPRGLPNDLGSQMRLPEPPPLLAPKP